MKVTWNEWTLGERIIFCSSICAAISLLMPWVDIGIVTRNGFSQGTFLLFACFLYPLLKLLSQKQLSFYPALGGSLLSTLLTLGYIFSKSVTMFEETKNVSGLGSFLFLLSSVSLGIGIVITSRYVSLNKESRSAALMRSLSSIVFRKALLLLVAFVSFFCLYYSTIGYKLNKGGYDEICQLREKSAESNCHSLPLGLFRIHWHHRMEGRGYYQLWRTEYDSFGARLLSPYPVLCISRNTPTKVHSNYAEYSMAYLSVTGCIAFIAFAILWWRRFYTSVPLTNILRLLMAFTIVWACTTRFIATGFWGVAISLVVMVACRYGLSHMPPEMSNKWRRFVSLEDLEPR